MSWHVFDYLTSVLKKLHIFMHRPNLPKLRRITLLAQNLTRNPIRNRNQTLAMLSLASSRDFRAYFEYPGHVEYNTMFADCQASAEELMRVLNDSQNPVAVSFDSKYPFDMVEGADYTAVITLAYNSQMCHIYHLTELKQLPRCLVECFHHPKIIIVGYCLEIQFKKLFTEHPQFDLDVILPRCIDVELMAHHLQPRKLKWGLSRLAHHYLNLRISDDFPTRNGRYDEVPMQAPLQIRTTTDTQVALMLYNNLKSIECRLRMTAGINVHHNPGEVLLNPPPIPAPVGETVPSVDEEAATVGENVTQVVPQVPANVSATGEPVPQNVSVVGENPQQSVPAVGESPPPLVPIGSERIQRNAAPQQ